MQENHRLKAKLGYILRPRFQRNGRRNEVGKEERKEERRDEGRKEGRKGRGKGRKEKREGRKGKRKRKSKMAPTFEQLKSSRRLKISKSQFVTKAKG